MRRTTTIFLTIFLFSLVFNLKFPGETISDLSSSSRVVRLAQEQLSPQLHEEKITIVTKNKKGKIQQVESSIYIDTFPDDELKIVLGEPKKIIGKTVKFEHSLKSATDFIEMLLIAGTLKQYKAKQVSLTITDWKYDISSREDRYLIQILRLFADNVSIKGQEVGRKKTFISLPKVKKIERKTKPFYIEKIAYLQERFRKQAQKAGSRLKKTEVSVDKIKVEKKSLAHWKVKLPEYSENDDVVLIHSTENSKNIVQLLLTLAALRETNNGRGVKSVSLINTYQGYSRQDKEFEPGEGISAHTVVKTLNHFLDYNFPINVHYGTESGLTKLSEKKEKVGIYVTGETGKKEIINRIKIAGRDFRVNNLNGFVQLGENIVDKIKHDLGKESFIHYLKNKPLLFLGPDKGSFPYVEEAAKIVEEKLREKYNLEEVNNIILAGYLKKKRISPTDTEIKELEIYGKEDEPLGGVDYGKIKNYRIVLLDDETSTGSTIKNAVYHLTKILKADKEKIYGGVVHGKFVYGIDEFLECKPDEKLPTYFAVMNTLTFSPQVYNFLNQGTEKMGMEIVPIDHLITHAIKRILGQPPE